MHVSKLSVVVPFHNVESYLGAALESVARQTFSDLEVVMVDDGSTDGSALVAKDFASRDRRFHLIQQERAGPGPARNAGIRQATGAYLGFLDGDDLLDPHAYALLTASLEKTGSDIAAGGCTKFSAAGPAPSWLHDEPFRRTALRTHVSRFPALLQDRTVWNKVYRRSFWDRHGFEFAPGVYEDPPVAIRAHVLASSVDVLHDVLYYWRVRDSGELSTTQRSREMANIEQRMAAIGDVAGFLTAQAPLLKPVFDASVIKGDMALLVGAFETASEADRARIAELASDYLRGVDPSVYQTAPVLERLTSYLLGRRMLPELLAVLRHNRWDPSPPVVRRDGPAARWCARYPFFQDRKRGIPDDIYDVTSEMTLVAGLDRVEWHGQKLRVEGFGYISRLSSATPSECQIRVTMRNSRTRRNIRLPVTRVARPDVTARSGQSAACYDWSGFAAEVDTRRLATLPGVWRASNWELRVEVSGDGLAREGPVGLVAPGSAQWPEGRWAASEVWLQPAPERDGRFVVRGQRVTALATTCAAGDGTLEVEGWSHRPLSAGATLVAAPRKGGAAVTAPAEALPAPPGGRRGLRRRHGFRARVPASALARPQGSPTRLDRVIPVHDEYTWDLWLDSAPGAGPPCRLAIDRSAAGARVTHESREVTAFATHFGALSLLERSARPVVTSLRWEGSRLLLGGASVSPTARPAELTLRHVSSGREHSFPARWDGEKFTAELAPGRMPGLAGPLPLPSGAWRVLAATGRADDAVAVAADRRLLPTLPGYHRFGLHEMEAQPYNTDALRLHVRTARPDDQRGPRATRRLATAHYPAAAKAPVRDLAVFDSFGGRHCSGNPRAIFEELRRARPGLECAWVTHDGQFDVPEGTRLVLADSREHAEALAQARYVVVNDQLPSWYRKREGQTCLQTWHGTPLKRIGLDIARPQFPTALIHPERVRSASGNWDVLLSPNPFSTPVFRHAFGYGGEILEAGYPRNDLLHRPERHVRAAEVRRRLGLPPGKSVILYAPTWRDNMARASGGYQFDLQLDLGAMGDALGDDHVLLLRLHTHARHSPAAREASRFVLPVTDYPDITDLLLITDVLITDYSSVMFDFAGTGRPILCYTYDLETYRDELRGFYVDFEAQAPGPLLSATSDVIDALRDLGTVERQHADAYREFARTYCCLDDGHAASRVVQRLLADR